MKSELNTQQGISFYLERIYCPEVTLIKDFAQELIRPYEEERITTPHIQNVAYYKAHYMRHTSHRSYRFLTKIKPFFKYNPNNNTRHKPDEFVMPCIKRDTILDRNVIHVYIPINTTNHYHVWCIRAHLIDLFKHIFDKRLVTYAILETDVPNKHPIRKTKT